MSMPFYSIRCTSCIYEGAFHYDTAYEFVDQHGDGYSPRLCTAWCESCEEVVMAATAPTEMAIESEVVRLRQWIEEEQAPKRKFIFFSKKQNSELIRRWQKEIDHLKRGVEFFRVRQMKSRCLKCGGENLTLIDLTGVGSKLEAIGVDHHRCGGEILAAAAGRITFGSLPRVRYDIDGRILHDERDGPPIDEHVGNDAIIGLASAVSVSLLDTLTFSEEVETRVHLESTILALYLTVHSFLKATDHEGDAVSIALAILATPPFIKETQEGFGSTQSALRRLAAPIMQLYADAAEQYLGMWPYNEEACSAFSFAVRKILLSRLKQYSEAAAEIIDLENFERVMARQPEALYLSFKELARAGKV